jgi:ubiquinone/menaquinone biosynthesis C-methylase UbiE
VNRGSPCTKKDEKTINQRLTFIIENMNFGGHGKLLDIGMGYGIYTKPLCELVGRYDGIDIIIDNVEEARKNFKEDNCFFHQMSAEKLDFDDNTFDNIMLIEVLEHVEKDQMALSEVYRVLKSGGKLIVTVPNKLFPLETHGMRLGSFNIGSKGFGIPLIPFFPETIRKHISNARLYTEDDIKKILNDTGFSISNLEYLSPNFDTIRLNFPKLDKFVKILDIKFQKIERSQSKFLPTIIICAYKP